VGRTGSKRCGDLRNCAGGGEEWSKGDRLEILLAGANARSAVASALASAGDVAARRGGSGRAMDFGSLAFPESLVASQGQHVLVGQWARQSQQQVVGSR